MMKTNSGIDTTGTIKENSMTNLIDTARHDAFFNPANLEGQIDIIGVGAVGSKVAMEIAKLGLKDIRLWDGDEVESHNIANQAFHLSDIGKPKVVAMQEHIKSATGLDVVANNRFITDATELGRVVFLCVDTMAARKEIFEKCLKNNFITEQVIEVRMGEEELCVYAFNPCARSEIINWEATLIDDAQTVESACGARTTVGATASMTSALAVTRFMQWFKWKTEPSDGDVMPKFEQVVMLRPLITISN